MAPATGARPPTVGAPRPPPAIAPQVAPGQAARPPAVAAAPARPPAAPGARPASAPSIAPLVPPIAPGIAPLVPPIAPAGAKPPTFAPGNFPPPAPSTPDTTLEGDALLSLDARYAKLEQSDYFQVLQVDQAAGPGDIKKAFYRESRSLHPDRFYHLKDAALKERVGELYKRITEAYYFLRDDVKRKKYIADINGPEREKKLRFTEATEAEVKAQTKKEQEEQIGTNPKARGFYTTAMTDMDGERWESAKRNLKMALTYEPSNARYKEKLAEVEKKLDSSRDKGDAFKIK